MASHVGRGQDTPAPRTRLPDVHRRLAQPRPPLERPQNQYVETPLRPPHPIHPHDPKPLDTRLPHQSHQHDSNFALVNLPVTTAPTKAPGIVCDECNRCRCASCRTPRPLPSALLCGTACLCSPAAALDYVTCMCVPKACSYHCSEDPETTGRPSWWCLALSTLVCPCLVCYLPCRGLLWLCEACHRVYTTPGCRCAHKDQYPEYGHSLPLEKRLLDSPQT